MSNKLAINTPRVQDIIVSACVLSLASNIDPCTNLALAKTHIEKLGKTLFSPVIQSACVKQLALPSDNPMYHNQVVYVTLAQPLYYQALLALTKSIEQLAKRAQFAKPCVTLDIDILVIQTDEQRPNLLDETGQAFIKLNNGLNNSLNNNAPQVWLGVARRFPLPDYDRQGLAQLPAIYHQLFV